MVLAGSDIPIVGSLSEEEEAACCELDLHVAAVRRVIIQLYVVTCCIRYLLAGAYHLGWTHWLFEWLFEWMAPSFLGGAGSALWPVFVLALVLDVCAVRALLRREDASPFIIWSWIVSVGVLFLDGLIAGLVDLDFWGTSWGVAELQDSVAEFAGSGLTKLTLFGFWWPKKVAIALGWAAVDAVLLAVSHLSRSEGD